MAVNMEEMRDLSDDQLRREILQLREERFRLRFRSATMQLENPRLIRTLGRDIARLRTILRERELMRQGQ